MQDLEKYESKYDQENYQDSIESTKKDNIRLHELQHKDGIQERLYDKNEDAPGIQAEQGKSAESTGAKNSKHKKKTKFIDFSKASLGFELSFSLPRVFSFLFMIFGFVALVFLKLFYPIAYLLGISTGVVLLIIYLLIESWNEA